MITASSASGSAGNSSRASAAEGGASPVRRPERNGNDGITPQEPPPRVADGRGRHGGHALPPCWPRGLLPALAWKDLPDPLDGDRLDPHRFPVVDGSFVMNAGELQINITNFGLIGSQYSWVSTIADAPSAQWPAGSGVEYLWGAGLWVGAADAGRKIGLHGRVPAG